MTLRRSSFDAYCSGELSASPPKLQKRYGSEVSSPRTRFGSLDSQEASAEAVRSDGRERSTSPAGQWSPAALPASPSSQHAMERSPALRMTRYDSSEFDTLSGSSVGRSNSSRPSSRPSSPLLQTSPAPSSLPRPSRDDRRAVQSRRTIRMGGPDRLGTDWMGVPRNPIGSGALDMTELAEPLDESKPATRSNASFADAAVLRARSIADARSARDEETVRVESEAIFLEQLDWKLEKLSRLLHQADNVLTPAELKQLLETNKLGTLWRVAKICVQSRSSQDYTRAEQRDTAANIRAASHLQLLCSARNRKCTLYGRVIGNELKLRGTSDYGVSMLSQTLGISTPSGIREYRNNLIAANGDRFQAWLQETIDWGKALVVLMDDLHFGFAPRNPMSAEELYVNRDVANCLAIRLDENAIVAEYDDKHCVTAHPPAGAEWTKIDRYTSHTMTSTMANGFVDSMGNLYRGNYMNAAECASVLRAFDYAQPDHSEERRLFCDAVCLVDVFDLKLKSWDAWLKSAILLVDRFRPYLEKGWLILMPGDWPVQFYFRLLVRQYLETNIPRHFLNCPGMGILDCRLLQHFVPLLGPFHCGLNLIEDVEQQFHAVFVKFYAAVFGKRWQDKPRVHRVHTLVAIMWGAWRKVRVEILSHIKGTELQRYPEVQCLWWLLDTLVPLACDLYSVIFKNGTFERWVQCIAVFSVIAAQFERRHYDKATLVFFEQRRVLAAKQSVVVRSAGTSISMGLRGFN